MRKITSKAVRAFNNDFTFSESNTKVRVFNDKTELYLFDNLIAKKDRKTGVVSITDAGWDSRTTKERLNGLDGVSIYTRKGVVYLNDNEWDGSWTTLGEESEPMEPLGFMKAFLKLGDLTSSENTPISEKVRYKEKIVFATMKSEIPNWEPPSDWNSLPDEVKLERLTKIESV